MKFSEESILFRKHLDNIEMMKDTLGFEEIELGNPYMAEEKDPNGLPLNSPGAKADFGKAPMDQGINNYFPRALLAIAEVSDFGAKKYTWNGWEKVTDGVNRYRNAMCRHAVKRVIEGEFDKDSNLLHRAHEAWNCLASLELYLREKETAKE